MWALGAATIAALTTLSVAVPLDERALAGKRQNPTNDSAVVDLGYSIYQGVQNTSTGITSWLGMRYAASPEGKNRWQPPQPPETDRNATKQANAYSQRCPQGSDAPPQPGLNYTGSEDCLFLSVQSPIGATEDSSLPVFVTIHGGGYGQGSGAQDLTNFMNANNNSFIGVAIQYRLGAFGFLSSDEVKRFGTPNAGILDQTFSLQWVQKYIHLFGGDPTKVTVSGESAGGGSVMLQTMANGGTLGTSLFQNAIVASPYLPMQYGYADFMPSQAYYAFAQQAGCFNGTASRARKGSEKLAGSVFDCLVSKDTATLQSANNIISPSGLYGTWAFLPVTDGDFIQDRPSSQLQAKKVNGVNMLSGNNANEGPSFVPQNITTEDDFEAYIRRTFPLFSDDEVALTLRNYPSSDGQDDPSDPKYATAGDMGATALNESTYGTGQQQRADNLYAETTFVCPSYWLAEAFSGNSRTSYKYQYSVIAAQHGSDVAGYFGPRPRNHSPEFEAAFQQLWGNFVTKSNPSIPSAVANGNSTAGTNPASDWPVYSVANPYQINLNETGGTPFSVAGAIRGQNVTEFQDPGLINDIRLVDAYSWEGGRGARCDFWREVGAKVPE